MFSTVINFVDVVLAGLLAGSMFCVWLVLNPAGLSASVYVTLQQQAIRRLNKSMPALGAATILMTLAAGAMGRADSMKFRLLMSAVLCFAAVGFVTRFLNQPINAVVMTWSSDAPPAAWMTLRDEWWRWHLLRLLGGMGGLSLVVAAILTRNVAG